MSFYLPALPGEGERQGLWGDSVAGQASPGRHKLPDKGSSSMHRFMAGNTCPRILYKNGIWKDFLSELPASGPRSWATGLDPFPVLEPDTQGCFLQ